MNKTLILLERIGRNIKALRHKKNLTQEQLADLCPGMDRCLISRIERFEHHDIKISTLIKLAEALNVNIAYLLK